MLKNGDCLKLLNDIPQKSVDMILCDPPYGTTACKWDVVLPFEDMWKAFLRVTKENAAMVLFGTEPFTSFLITSNPKLFRQKLTWLKTRPTNVFNAKKQFMNWTEDVLIFYRKPPVFHPQMRTDGVFTGQKIQRANTDRSTGTLGSTGERKGYVHKPNGGLFYPKTVLEFSNVHNRKEHFHPTQKPVNLLEYLIKTYTDEGDTVLDPCMGSGSTGVACVNTERNFIGVEKDRHFFEIAESRIGKAECEKH